MRPAPTMLFSALERSGRFHRDSALGRIFHPGTVSYREISATNSLHLAVKGDNRVSVHIDRVAPLAVRVGRRCRYSVSRVVMHNVLHVVEAIDRLVHRRRGANSCHLECEIVWVADDEEDKSEDETGAESDVA